MCRLWCLFVFVRTMFRLPRTVCPRSSSSTHPIRSGGSTFIRFYSATAGYRRACASAFGNDIPGHTVNDFGQIDQCGSVLRPAYLLFGARGAATGRFKDFHNIARGNPCTV
jgi:hypothetical protein